MSFLKELAETVDIDEDEWVLFVARGKNQGYWGRDEAVELLGTTVEIVLPPMLVCIVVDEESKELLHLDPFTSAKDYADWVPDQQADYEDSYDIVTYVCYGKPAGTTLKWAVVTPAEAEKLMQNWHFDP